MKKTYKLIGIVTALAAVALLANVSLAADTGLSDIQAKAAADCWTFKNLLQQYQIDLTANAAGTEKYHSLKNDIVASNALPSIKLPGIESPIKTLVDGFYTSKMQTPCDSIKNATNSSTAKTAYDAFINDKRALSKALSRINKAADYYAGYQELADSMAYLSSLRNNSLKNTYDNAAFATETTYLAGLVEKVKAKIPNLVAIASLTAILNTPTDSNLNAFDYSLQTRKTQLDGLNNEFRRNAVPAMRNIMEGAAKNNVTGATGLPYSADYAKILAGYNKKKDGLNKTLANEIISQKKSLNQYTAKLNAAGALGNLSSAIKTTLINNINTATNVLTALSDSLPQATYNGAVGVDAQINNLLVKPVIIKNIDSAIDFDQTYGKVSSTRQTCLRFSSSFAVLKNGLTSADQTILEGIQEPFASNCAVIGDLMDKTNIETAITSNGNTTTMATLANLLNAYYGKFAAASKKINGYRSQWWKLIEKAVAANVGNSIFNNAFRASELINEQRAAALFQNFEAKRESYMTKARKLIDSRKIILEQNREIMNELTNVPGITAGATLKSTFDAKLNTLLGTGAGSLEAYYIQIESVADYNELVERVNGLKAFQLNEVVIPLQKIYVKLDSYLGKDAGLKAVKLVLDGRINGLASASGQITASQANIADMLSELDTLFSDIVAAATNALTALDADQIRSEVNPKMSAAGSLISQIGSEERKLLGYIRQAEKDAAAAALAAE